MILGIMQPYFFPYLGYFDLINCSDKWIVFDSVQYIRHGWINRNRILHPSAGWSYIIVPVNFARSTPIREVGIVNDGKWQKRILGQLQHYKKKAPYYQETLSLINDCFSCNETCISRFNSSVLEKVCKYIGIHFDYDFFSEMGLEIGQVQEPGDWALRISQAVGATEYINPPGGEKLFDKNKFASSNIKLTIRNLAVFVYDCPGYEFIPSLSIIDILMWNHPAAIKEYLDDHRDQISNDD